jgi:hypothetical protein
MRTPISSLVAVAAAASVAALPPGFALDGGRFTLAGLLPIAGAGLAAAAWLALLVEFGVVRRLGFVAGGAVGLLALGTVLVIIFSVPAEPGATGTVGERVAWMGLFLFGFGPYAFLAGGVFGHILRGLPVRDAA